MIFASRIQRHRNPFGSVNAGTPVVFTLTPPKPLAWLRVWLCLQDEFGGRYSEQRLTWLGLDGEDDLFRLELDTTSLLGPIWYWFRFEDKSGQCGFLSLHRGMDDGEGVICYENPTAWQLTVAKADAQDAPAWFGQGVTYHIFPDRFRRSATPNPAGMVGNRRVHRRWGDCPDFMPDENGEIRNRDFYGGDIEGVLRKLPYIKSLGVTTIYFSPIFEAASSHRYDTACYTRIDPMFGTEEELRRLCAEARDMGIRIILDGVFNHTGYDSVYFNARGTYPGLGAYQSPDSPYYDWYDFSDWPDHYSSWWGFYTLPQINESNQSYRDFIIHNKDSVVRRWIQAGIAGWRLDVADELPDDFIAELYAAVKEEDPEAIVIGEVWEDASQKIAYSVRRRYLLGGVLDGVMNYPLRDAIIGFVLGGDAREFRLSMEVLRENYPKSAFYSLMNALGTHDTPRILTVLGATHDEWQMSRTDRALHMLPPDRYALAVSRLKLATAVLYAFPGSPCVFYGDEAGLEGFEDPFNRRTYPWEHENPELIAWYTLLGSVRSASAALRSGDLRYHQAGGSVLVFERRSEDSSSSVYCCINRGDAPADITLPWTESAAALDLLTNQPFKPDNGILNICLEPMSAYWLWKGGR